ncbi:PilN domain-containing protein [Chitinimonas lacunae]|uniref:PilN domain-containing protein n=1 Tax=Chitinimonas lacunae TaxID=1963018 RepID=A0ABV8MXJ8_9NEIS
MKRRLNLYNAALLPRADRLDLMHGVFYLVTALLLAGIALGLVRREAAQREQAAAQAQAALNQKTAELAQLSNRPRPTVDGALVAAIATARAERDRLDQALILGGQLAPPPQFSRVLAGLARTVPDEVWLTSLVVDSGGMVLEGWATQADPVAQLAQRLGRDPAFGGRRFARFELERQPPPGAAPSPIRPPGEYRFVLTSQERAL